MKSIKFFIIIITVLVVSPTKAQTTFTDLESFLKYAVEKSTSLQSSEIKLTQAKKAKLAAIISIPDPSGNLSFSYTDNTQLAAQIVDGKALTFGTKYTNNYNNYQEVKLLNLPGWSSLRSSKANLEAVLFDTKLTRKSLYENIATTYFNIVLLQEQLRATKENLLANDTIYKISENKYQAGILKKQDVNDTKVSYLNTKENVNQIQFQIDQQIIALKILADIPDKDSIAINHLVEAQPSATTPAVEFNSLSLANAIAKEKLALYTFRKNNYGQLPTISFFSSGTQQQYNAESGFVNNSGPWVNSSYIGLKLSVPIPGASMFSSIFESRYNYQLAQKNSEHAKIKAELDYKQLSTDYSKAWSQYVTNNEVYKLKKDSYEKNLNLYRQGLLSTDVTLNSFNAMVNGNYNLISSVVNLLLANSKIDINNTIK